MSFYPADKAFGAPDITALCLELNNIRMTCSESRLELWHLDRKTSNIYLKNPALLKNMDMPHHCIDMVQFSILHKIGNSLGFTH